MQNGDQEGSRPGPKSSVAPFTNLPLATPDLPQGQPRIPQVSRRMWQLS